MDMSIPYEAIGRVRQKERTRNALISAARELVAEGGTPTVEEAAETAGISRTTAYRYFPNQRALLVAAHPETQATSLLPPDPPQDPAGRLEAVIDAFTQLIAATEPQQRTMLRPSLEPEHTPALLRRAPAIAWREEPLSPLRGQFSTKGLRRLVLASRTATGNEARV